ncbi:probable G-protein coupled receptor 179 [Lagopus muta]|uniref:probable G-protein coupled receptor 179 n=1 Tax=Lagopus muta TaxID=64668 RepID=UPI00209FB58B|nr:probable G-protein coupled receptor 179 [Lagopus muta]
MLLQGNDLREASVAEDVEWYQALTRSLAGGHPWARRSLLALDAHPAAPSPRLVLQATAVDGEIHLRDVSAPGNRSSDGEWVAELRERRGPPLRKRVLSNDLRSMETPKWRRGDGYVAGPGHVRWSQPFLECRDGKFVPVWAVALSAAFYGLKPDLSPEFKGAVRVDIELRDVGIDQCDSGTGWFAGTHRCDLNSTQCVPQQNRGFVLGQYACRCKPGFYGLSGGAVPPEDAARLACRRCREGCANCRDDAPCEVQEDRALRAAVLCCQACCMLAVFLCMLLAYHCRRSKRIRASGVVLLETILFGSLLLYFPVFILYFKPSTFRCIALRWVRVLGFAIVYGTITLKLYRVLRAFLVRAAQRVSYTASGRVLRALGLLLLPPLWFLAAWTVAALENVGRNVPLVVRAQTARGLNFSVCSHDRWDYMMVVAELLLLLWGSALCWAARAVPSAFHEPRYMGIALHNELLLSAAFHAVRFIAVPSLHPDWMLLLCFAHTHGTVTVTLGLLFVPKFLHAGSPLREEIAAEVYEDEVDARRSGLSSSIASAWSERSFDPDDIREELKQLYAQLETLRTRRMAARNPHLPASPPARSSGSRRSSSKRPHDGTGGGGREGGGQLRSRSSEHPAQDAAAGGCAEPSDNESLCAAPLLPRSASAQQLGGHGQPTRLRAVLLQKSLSAGAGAVTPSSAPSEQEGVSLCTAATPAAATPPAPLPDGGPPRDASPPADSKGTKSVTYAPVKSVSADGPHPTGRVRVVVKRTPPPPPVRYQSLPHRHGDKAEPPRPPEGTAAKPASPPSGLRSAPPIPAEVCPWELLQEEMLRQKQNSGESPTSDPPGDTAGIPPSLKPPPQKAFRSLGFAIRAINRSRAKRSLKGSRESSDLKRGREQEEGGGGGQPGLVETPPPPPAGSSPDPNLWDGDVDPSQCIATSSASETPMMGDSEGTAEGQKDGAAGGGTGAGEGLISPSVAMQPSGIDALCVAQSAGSAGPRAEVCPWEALSAPGGSASQQEGTGGVLTVGSSPMKGLGKGGSQPAAWGGGSEGLPTRSRSAEVGVSPWDTERGAGGQGGAQLDVCRVLKGDGKPGWRGTEEHRAQQAERGGGLGGRGDTRISAVSTERGNAEPRKSQSAEICPWEGQGGSGVSKAEICPWEEQGGSGGSKEEICPWESQGGLGGNKAEICPWEEQEGSGVSKAEICPWESQGGSAGSKAEICPQEGQGGSGGSKAEICPWEGQGGSGGSKAEICPWEEQEGPGVNKAEICPWESQGGPGGSKEEICPWETATPPVEQLRMKLSSGGAAKRITRQAALVSPARSVESMGVSRSAESPKAEICPWETLGSSGGREEICPWEGAAPPSDKGELREAQEGASGGGKGAAARRGLQKERGGNVSAKQRGSGEREAVCPWESAELCTLRGQEPRARDKAEICPWEEDLEEGAPGKAKSLGDSRAAGMGSSQREAVCPWESVGAEEPALSTATGKEGSRKRESAESRAAVCPWEAAEPGAGQESCSPGEQPRRAAPVGVREHRALRRILPAAPGRAHTAQQHRGPSTAEVCPWEAEEGPEAPSSPTLGAVAVCRGEKSPGEGERDAGASSAEVCPWDCE